MCGLVGVAGISNGAMDKALRTLLVLDTVRGEHSTGVLFVGSKGSTEIHKAVGNPYNLFDSRKYNIELGYANNVLMGHNRYATAGAVNKMNAHPFELEHIIGAHNGTISTQYKLDNHKNFTVDSENIFYHISKHGIQETTKLLGGAYALTWWDSNEETINFVRNKERPLCYAYTLDRKGLLWASEEWMIKVAAEKSRLGIGMIHTVPVGKHMALNIPLGSSIAYPPLGEFVTEVVEQYTVPKRQASTKKTKTKTKTGGGGTSVSTTGGLLDTLRADLIGVGVEFVVVKPHATLKHCILCKIIDHPAIDAQINLRQGCVASKKLLSTPGVIFEADIKRIAMKNGNATIILDSKTLAEVLVEPEPEESNVSVLLMDGCKIDGKPVPMSEYLKVTAFGCVCCGDVPPPHESPKLFWVNKEVHVCSYCINDERIKEHYGN
jgi:hypothetical protein